MVEILHYLNRFQKVTLSGWERQAMSDFEGRDYTYADVASQIVRLNLAFKSAGLVKGDKVAICGKNSVHWGMAFLATAVYEAVAVPILYGMSPASATELCNHSDSSLLFTDVRTFTKIDLTEVRHLNAIINIEDFSCLWARDYSFKDAFDDAEAAFMREYPKGLSKEDIHFGKECLDDIEVINYANSAEGNPRGIMLTGRNLSANIQFALETIKVTGSDSSISMLPLAQMYGLTFEFLYALCGGSHIYFLNRTPSPCMLRAVCGHVKPYMLITVPQIMEKVMKSMVLPALERPAAKLLAKIPVLNKLFYRFLGHRVMAMLGGRIREITVGGAIIDRQLEEVMRATGLPFSAGYGMNECAPLIAYAPHDEAVAGSYGRAMEQYDEVRINSYVPDRIPGEIQVRGANVMAGYYNDPDADAAAFTEDGWLRTGDLGLMDRDGNIYVVGTVIHGHAVRLKPQPHLKVKHEVVVAA